MLLEQVQAQLAAMVQVANENYGNMLDYMKEVEYLKIKYEPETRDIRRSRHLAPCVMDTQYKVGRDWLNKQEWKQWLDDNA